MIHIPTSPSASIEFSIPSFIFKASQFRLPSFKLSAVINSKQSSPFNLHFTKIDIKAETLDDGWKSYDHPKVITWRQHSWSDEWSNQFSPKKESWPDVWSNQINPYSENWADIWTNRVPHLHKKWPYKVDYDTMAWKSDPSSLGWSETKIKSNRVIKIKTKKALRQVIEKEGKMVKAKKSRLKKNYQNQTRSAKRRPACLVC